MFLSFIIDGGGLNQFLGRMRGVFLNGGCLLHTPCDMKVFSDSKFGSSGTLCCLHYSLQGFPVRCRAVSVADGDTGG